MPHLEGRAGVLAALAVRRRTFEAVLIGEDVPADRAGEVERAAGEAGVAVRRVPAAELDAVAHGRTHGGIVALCGERPLEGPAELARLLDGLQGPPLLLLLEGADDPRNLGFTLRSAEALGVQAVLLRRRAWDFDSVEVSRPSSGAFERLPVVRFDGTELIADLKKRGLKLYGCVAGASRTIYETQLWKPCVIAVGGEKRGLSGAVRDLCNSIMKIPTRAGSLSLTAAADVVLGEAARQRTQGGPQSPVASPPSQT